jgi:DNA (cytosine-5)-methyltransferase 1
LEAKRLGYNVQRPLKRKTLFRIANGTKRYVIENKKPFIVRTGHYSNKTGKGAGFRGQGVDQPLGTVCSTNDKGLALPYLVAYYSSGSGKTGHRVDAPMQTVTTADRFGLATAHAVQVNHGGLDGRSQEVSQPLPTITGSHGTGVVAASLIQYNQEKGRETRGQDVASPLNTVTTENRFALVSAFIARIGQYGSNGKMSNDARSPLTTITSKQEHVVAEAALAPLVATTSHTGTTGRGKYVDLPTEPLKTITASNDKAAVVAHITQFYGDTGQPPGKTPGEPLPTITAVDHNGLVQADLVKAGFISSHYGDRPDGSSSVGHSAEVPLPTITARATQNQVAVAHLTRFFGQSVGSDPADPMPTQCSQPKDGTVIAHLAQVGHRDDKQPGRAVDQPLNTILGKEHHTLIATNLVRCAHGEGDGKTERWGRGEQPVTEPLPTVTASKDFAASAAFLVHMNNGEKQWSAANEPLRTITAGGNHHYEAEAWLVKHLGPGVWEAFSRIYEFLREHLGEDAPLPIVELPTGLYLIVDIGLRMLSPRELLNAQFSPELAKDYILIGTKSQQVKMIGNSVPPLLAAAVWGANPLCGNRQRERRKAG